MRRASEKRRAVLLIEFVTSERWIYPSRLYPFIKGCAEKLGIDSIWLCLGAVIAIEKSGNADVIQYMKLSEDEESFIEEHVRQLEPTHLIINYPISPLLLKRIKEAAGGELEILSMSDLQTSEGVMRIYDLVINTMSLSKAHDDSAGNGRNISERDASEVEKEIMQTDWLLSWFGVEKDRSHDFGKYIVGTIPPSYRVVMGNRKAQEYKPHIMILGGILCDHFKKVKDDPLYRDIDLSPCTQDYGCTFCTHYRKPVSDMNIDPVSIAEEQFRRIIETTGTDGRSFGYFDIHDIRLFRNIESFFEMILRVGVPPATFYFEPRLDRFLEVSDKMEEILSKLAATGHVISIYRMGAESLVEEENLFYHKGFSLQEIDAAAKRLRELSQKFPKSFEYDPTFGYITCSPWTTLEMLEKGIERAMERGFEPKDIWLYTPLLLYHGAPITQLAKKEGGIVLDKHEDLSLLYEASVNQVSFNNFLPWQFKDERTGVAFAMIVRFCAAALRDKYSDAIFHGDELYNVMLENDSIPGFFERPDLFAREAVKTVKSAERPLNRMQLMKTALARYAEIPKKAIEKRYKLRFLLDAVRDRFKDYFSNVSVKGLSLMEGRYIMSIELAIGNTNYNLFLSRRSNSEISPIQSEHFSVTYKNEFTPASISDLRKITQLIKVFDRAVTQYAPDLI